MYLPSFPSLELLRFKLLARVRAASLFEAILKSGAHPLQDSGVAMEQVRDVGTGEHYTQLEGELLGRLLQTQLPEFRGAHRAVPE